MGSRIFAVLALAAFQISAQASTPSHAQAVNADSAGPKEDLSRLAGRMLDDTNQARAALHKGDHQAAIQDVRRAQHDLQEVRSQAHGDTVIPVYQEFVSVSILDPVVAEKKSRKAGATAVNEVAGEYSQVTVNTTVAENALAAAAFALKKGDWKTADAGLSDVQDGVQIESVKADLPLARARENLVLARQAARDGHYSEARATLESTSKALSTYAAEGGVHAAAAKQLHQQIDTFAQSLPAAWLASGSEDKQLVEHDQQLVKLSDGTNVC